MLAEGLLAATVARSVRRSFNHWKNAWKLVSEHFSEKSFLPFGGFFTTRRYPTTRCGARVESRNEADLGNENPSNLLIRPANFPSKISSFIPLFSGNGVGANSAMDGSGMDGFPPHFLSLSLPNFQHQVNGVQSSPFAKHVIETYFD